MVQQYNMNFLEELPVLLYSVLVAGLILPKLTTFIGVVIGILRIIYGYGNIFRKPEYQRYSAIGLFAGQAILFVFAFWSAILFIVHVTIVKA